MAKKVNTPACRVKAFRKRMSDDGRCLLTCYVQTETKEKVDAMFVKRLAKRGGKGNIHLGMVIDEIVRKGKA